jgi:hypothetical protein
MFGAGCRQRTRWCEHTWPAMQQPIQG